MRQLPTDAQTIWDDLSYENSISITSKLIQLLKIIILTKLI
jgi:hypothetical protein